jgi:ubiquinone/menaquinone biosynthesis C-methylase UbiE
VENYEPIMSFGEDVAEIYDNSPRGDESVAVAFLEQLAGGGPALELAIGTGRIALPLAARGVRVDGVDISPAMLAKLRSKPGEIRSPPATSLMYRSRAWGTSQTSIRDSPTVFTSRKRF